MKRTAWALVGTFLLAAIINANVMAKNAKVDEPAPDFSLTDATGKSHKLSDFKGKYVVLEWVNYDCPFVRKHYRSGNMQSLQKEYTGKDVVWLSICSSADGKQGHFEREELTERIKEENVSATAYLIDADGSVGKTYEAKTTPHMFVIDPKGTLIYAGGIDNKPSTDKDDIAEATNYVRTTLDAAMAGKAIAVKGSKPYGCSVKYK
ncbi:MAG: thioredoxin family protein [Bacteroidota bacterium]